MANIAENHVDIVNRALTAIRARGIRSLTDDDERSSGCANVYWTEIAALLTARKWHFNTLLSRLQTVDFTTSADPVTERRGWTHGHKLPADRVAPPAVLFTDPETGKVLRVFELDAGMVLSEEPVVFARCQRLVPPALWPSYFVKLAVTAVAAALAAPIRGDEGMAEQLRVLAYGTNAVLNHGGLMKIAGDLDHAARPPEEFAAGTAFVGERELQGTSGYRQMIY